MKKWPKLIPLLVLMLFLLVSLAGCGGGQDKAPAAKTAEKPEKKVFELKIGGGHPIAGMPYVTASAKYFEPEVAKRVAAKTNYEIKWIEAYGGTVAKLAEAHEACETGLLDFSVNSYPFEPTKLFLMNMPYYIPFNTPDPVQATRVTRKVINEFSDVYNNLFKQYNQKLLAVSPTGDYELLTMFPVEKLADVKGKKIAAAGPNLTLLEGTGATPVQSNLNEAYTSFQTGVYQGWIMYAGSSYGFKLHELAKYHTNVGFGACTIQGISVNLDTWNKLPKEVQDIIEEVAAEYEIEAAKVAKQADEEALKAMAAAGVKIVDLPDAEKAKWAAGLPNVPQEKALEAEKMGYPGKAIFQAYIKYLEEDGYKFPRKWVIE